MAFAVSMNDQRQQTVTVREALRASTAEWHARVDGRIAPLLASSELSAYVAVLRALWGFYVPLEDAFALVPVDRYGIWIAERRKRMLISDDLASLGVDVESLPLCADLPAMRTVGAVLGCHYVIEGSTLGGRVIARQMSQRLNLAPGRGLSFFTGYGPQTESMWKSLVQGLELAGADGLREEICAGAVDCFRCLDRWLETLFGDSSRESS